MLKGYYPCSEDGAVYLAGIVLSITHGDYNRTMHSPEFVKYVFMHVIDIVTVLSYCVEL